MNAFTRLIGGTLALLGALFFNGCYSPAARAPRPKSTVEFVVVESSTEKQLTPAQLAALRATVLAYLREQGLSGGRTYYVKVEFPAANPADEPQWAIVRINNLSTQAYTVIAAYPGSDDYYPYDYGRSGYSHGGYTGFTRYDYHDPYHHDPGKYSPPRIHYDHPKPDQPAHKRNHPPGTHTRWDRHPRTDGDQPRSPDTPPLAPTNGHRKRDHDPDHGRSRDDHPPRPTSGVTAAGGGSNRDYPPPPSYQAPAPEAPRSEPVQDRRELIEQPEKER
jgi:hypothetical protein